MSLENGGDGRTTPNHCHNYRISINTKIRQIIHYLINTHDDDDDVDED